MTIQCGRCGCEIFHADSFYCFGFEVPQRLCRHCMDATNYWGRLTPAQQEAEAGTVLDPRRVPNVG